MEKFLNTVQTWLAGACSKPASSPLSRGVEKRTNSLKSGWMASAGRTLIRGFVALTDTFQSQVLFKYIQQPRPQGSR